MKQKAHKARSLKRLVMTLAVWFRNLPAQPTAWAYRRLSKAMQSDAGYAYSWKANIAVTLMDRGGIEHGEANRLADHLMLHLFEVKCHNDIAQRTAEKPEGEVVK